jgi:glyoxylase-like metal-dependent hydrolase (beta-lactamase superfamily II)
MEIKSFCFNPFDENTYILYDETGDCAVIDPGCYNEEDQLRLTAFIDQKGLTPVKLINTHCHIDHIFGNHFIAEKYGLELQANMLEEETLNFGAKTASLYGLNYTMSPEIAIDMIEGETIEFGKTVLHPVFTPGHTPGGMSLLHYESRQVLVGDTLFFDSVGRTDLPGGDHATLIQSINEKLLILEDDWKAHSGHGPMTTIGRERKYNPFL